MAIKKTNQAEEAKSGLRGAERRVDAAEEIRTLPDETMERVAGGGETPTPSPLGISTNPYSQSFQ